MHSSRMCTGRSLTVCRSLLPRGGGSVCSQGGVCSGGMSARGCPAPGGVSALGGWGVCSEGGSAPRGGCGIPAHTEPDPSPVNRITDTSKNLTLATTSLRLVKITISSCFQGYQYTHSSLKRVQFKQVTNKLLQPMIY